MTPLAFEVPAKFANAALYARHGALIKNVVDGRIVGHVQEVGRLGGMLGNLPVGGVDPFSAGLKVLGMAQSHRQHKQVMSALKTLNLISSIGAVASVANLGVSVAGFAMTIRRLNQANAKLDILLGQGGRFEKRLKDLSLKADMMAMAELNSSIDEMLLMRVSKDGARRRSAIQRAIERLGRLRQYYAQLLATNVAEVAGTDGTQAVWEAQERLVAAAQGELLGEFLLEDDHAVMQQRMQTIAHSLDRLPMIDAQEVYRGLQRADDARGVGLVVDPAARQSSARTLTEAWLESRRRLESVPAIAERVRSSGLTIAEYDEKVESAGQDADSGVLIVC
jgi:hypothetical protein